MVHRLLHRHARLLRWVAVAVTVLFVGMVVIAMGLYAHVRVPMPAAHHAGAGPALPQASMVYSADGVELARFYREHRRWVSIEAIAPEVIDALIAVEDRRFRSHPGVDLRRLVAAAWHTARGRRQGGSTLTMQLVRNLDAEIARAPTWRRKVLEVFTAVKLERRYEKEEILEFYLNTVPFGARAFGIEAAAHTYFGVTAAELDAVQAATLIALLKGTTRYSPLRHPERARERRNLVLRLMEAHGSLDPERVDELTERPLGLVDRRAADATSDLAPHFIEHVRVEISQWAAERGLDLYADGLRVHTTLDTRLQRLAEETVAAQATALQDVAAAEWSSASMPVRTDDADAYVEWLRRSERNGFEHFWEQQPDLETEYIRRSQRYRELARQTSPDEALSTLRSSGAFMDSLRAGVTRLEAGLVTVDPTSGAVRAWVGGRDFSADQYDKVGFARRQPGSTFKPFVYATALESGFSPYDLVRDSVITHTMDDGRRTWRPANAHGGATNELVTLREALAYSLNTVAARLGVEVGPDHVAHVARRAGIESPLRAVPSLSLGTSEVTLLELAGAYATIASNGIRRSPHVITHVQDASGRTIERFRPATNQSLSPHTAHLTLDMLRDVVTYGTGAALRTRYGLEGDIAGKTGTSQHGADAWFLLMHPHLVTGVWVGFNDPRVRFRSRHWGQAASNALPIAGAFTANVLDERPRWKQATFQPPPGYHVPPPHFLAEKNPLDTRLVPRPVLDEPAPQDSTALERYAYLPMPEDLRARLLPELAQQSADSTSLAYDSETLLRQAAARGQFLVMDREAQFREQVLPVAPGLAREAQRATEPDAEQMLRSRLSAPSVPDRQ